jgi:hypothetical protein
VRRKALAFKDGDFVFLASSNLREDPLIHSG